MDISESKDIQQENFTDLVLILTDGFDKISIDVNKNELCSSSSYFKKLLTGFKEKSLNEITMLVSNVAVFYDVILSINDREKIISGENQHGMPQWLYLLDLFKCYDFLGLDFDFNLLFNLEIPEEGFGLLFDIAYLTNYHSDIIKLIEKNLPEDYDLTRLPRDLIDALLKIEPIYQITSGNRGKRINIWNALTGELIHTLDERVNCVRYMTIENELAKKIKKLII